MDPRPARRPTLADVARIAGTSTTVVSYVVNGTNRPVAPATRERVRAAIAQLDYRPNRAARALRVRSQRFIGLVVPATADPFYVAFADEIQASAMRRGYLTLTGSSGFNPDQEAALLEGLVDEEAAGVILVGLGESRDLRAVLESSPVPAVFLHHRPAGLSGPLVTIADREWARRATEHLLGHGHTELALLTHADDDGPVGMRMRGFRDAVEAAGIEPSLWRTDGYDRQAASRAVMTALEGGAAVPRGLVVTTDELAFGALHALAALRIDVPGDVAVISMDGVRETRTSVPELSTVAEPFAAMGEAAVSLLLDGDGDGDRVFDCELVLRDSCGCGRYADLA
ncbi:MAG: LacI family transcriptional regulator [Actinobacteria bacterium]|nr:LacI family transcriptional regulator [Actinomycetota bacterium]